MAPHLHLVRPDNENRSVSRGRLGAVFYCAFEMRAGRQAYRAISPETITSDIPTHNLANERRRASMCLHAAYNSPWGPIMTLRRTLPGLVVCAVLLGAWPVCRVQASVVDPPSIEEAFNPSSIPLFGASTLTYTIANPAANTVTENGVAFTDFIPLGITPFGLPPLDTCGGTASIELGQMVSLSGGSIAVNSSCTVSLTVVGTMLGSFTDTIGNVSSTNGGTGNTATATLDVGVTATPLPAALPLFATGLGGFGLLGWRRKRKVQAV
jgi:hypothetical protein